MGPPYVGRNIAGSWVLSTLALRQPGLGPCRRVCPHSGVQGGQPGLCPPLSSPPRHPVLPPQPAVVLDSPSPGQNRRRHQKTSVEIARPHNGHISTNPCSGSGVSSGSFPPGRLVKRGGGRSSRATPLSPGVSWTTCDGVRTVWPPDQEHQHHWYRLSPSPRPASDTPVAPQSASQTTRCALCVQFENHRPQAHGASLTECPPGTQN